MTNSSTADMMSWANKLHSISCCNNVRLLMSRVNSSSYYLFLCWKCERQEKGNQITRDLPKRVLMMNPQQEMIRGGLQRTEDDPRTGEGHGEEGGGGG